VNDEIDAPSPLPRLAIRALAVPEVVRAAGFEARPLHDPLSIREGVTLNLISIKLTEAQVVRRKPLSFRIALRVT